MTVEVWKLQFSGVSLSRKEWGNRYVGGRPHRAAPTSNLLCVSIIFWFACRGDPMWSPVTKKLHFPSVKQFDKPKFEVKHNYKNRKTQGGYHGTH